MVEGERGGGRRGEALLAGGCFALAALLASSSILAWADSSWRGLILTSTVAAFVTAAPLWRMIFNARRSPTFWRGVGVGALVGVVSHPPAWYLMLVWLYFTGAQGSLGERTMDPLNALWACFVYSALSLLLAGWATALVGGAVGGVLGYAAGVRRGRLAASPARG